MILTLLQIERIQNPYLYLMYMTKKAEMDARNPGVQNEKRLWHGTASNNVQNINNRNFNRSYGGVHGASCYRLNVSLCRLCAKTAAQDYILASDEHQTQPEMQ